MLHAAGERFRVSYPVPELPRCTIDVAFPRRKVAVFIDGCFWHNCPDHGSKPKANASRWATKLAMNELRDRRVDAHLRYHGWRVFRFWEHEDPSTACSSILDIVRDHHVGIDS